MSVHPKKVFLGTVVEAQYTPALEKGFIEKSAYSSALLPRHEENKNIKKT